MITVGTLLKRCSRRMGPMSIGVAASEILCPRRLLRGLDPINGLGHLLRVPLIETLRPGHRSRAAAAVKSCRSSACLIDFACCRTSCGELAQAFAQRGSRRSAACGRGRCRRPARQASRPDRRRIAPRGGSSRSLASGPRGSRAAPAGPCWPDRYKAAAEVNSTWPLVSRRPR